MPEEGAQAPTETVRVPAGIGGSTICDCADCERRRETLIEQPSHRFSRVSHTGPFCVLGCTCRDCEISRRSGILDQPGVVIVPRDEETGDENVARRCPSCRWILTEESTGDDGVCPHCHPECSSCGERSGRWTGEFLENGFTCTACLRSDYVYSEPEVLYVPRDQAVQSSDTEEWASEEHAQRNWHWDDWSETWLARNPGELMGFSARATQHFGWPDGVPRNALVYGVELEMEAIDGWCVDDAVEELGGRAKGDRFILKEDGSLKEGCELACAPMTLGEHREYWPRILQPGLLRVAHSGAGTDRCGIHVHINRRALSDLTVGKIQAFANNQSADGLVSCIAQRSYSGYAKASWGKKVAEGRYDNEDRYERVNTRSDTIEIRLFRGNLRPERVVKNVEFCDAVAKWAKTASVKVVEGPGAAENFLYWLDKRRKDYPTLVGFLVERGRMMDMRMKSYRTTEATK